jgi:hypothetical protein
LKILKLIWAHGQSGWHIRSGKSVELAPRGGLESDFYAIKDDIVISQPNFFGPTSYVMGQSIVPIVAIVDGEDTIRCLGTAFFISCTGILITAAHVITDPIDRKYGDVSTLDDLTWHTRKMNFGVMLPLNPILYEPGFLFLDVEWAMFLAERRENPLPISGVDLKLTSDIAICKVRQLSPTTPHQALSIKQRGIRGVGIDVGKTATAIGYAGMNEIIPLKSAAGSKGDDLRFDLHISKGKIIERFPDNMQTRSVAAPGPCFSTSSNYPGGMSGSPIFDDEMIYVHGVVSRGGLQDLSYGCLLEPSMHLPIKRLGDKSIEELRAVGGEGIPRISIPDA